MFVEKHKLRRNSRSRAYLHCDSLIYILSRKSIQSPGMQILRRIRWLASHTRGHWSDDIVRECSIFNYARCYTRASCAAELRSLEQDRGSSTYRSRRGERSGERWRINIEERERETAILKKKSIISLRNCIEYTVRFAYKRQRGNARHSPHGSIVQK